MLLERFDGLIEEVKDHVGVDIKENSLASYRQTRGRLQQFIQVKYKVSDLTFSQLTEDFIKQFVQFVTGEVGLKQSTCYNMIVLIAKRKKLAKGNGKTKTSLWPICHSNYRNKK